MRRVDANYWQIMQFKLLAGRLPDEDDDRLGRMVAVVNATSARRLFPGAAAVGQSGANLDYLANTLRHLTLLGVRDRQLELLYAAARTSARRSGAE